MQAHVVPPAEIRASIGFRGRQLDAVDWHSQACPRQYLRAQCQRECSRHPESVCQAVLQSVAGAVLQQLAVTSATAGWRSSALSDDSCRRSCFTTRKLPSSLRCEFGAVAAELESDSLLELPELCSSSLETMTILRAGFIVFVRCLEQVGDFGAFGGALTARLCLLRGGEDGGTSTAGVRVLAATGGAAVLVGSLRFLDPVPCSAGSLANAGTGVDLGTGTNVEPLDPPKSKGGGNPDGDCECPAVGDDAFPYLSAILCFSP